MSKEINDKLYEALVYIVSYDCHEDWLRSLCGELEKNKKKDRYSRHYAIPDDMKWHTEIHTIWMLLVGMFGDWGTSIRSGWIEDLDGCIEFIQGLIKADDEEDDEQ